MQSVRAIQHRIVILYPVIIVYMRGLAVIANTDSNAVAGQVESCCISCLLCICNGYGAIIEAPVLKFWFDSQYCRRRCKCRELVISNGNNPLALVFPVLLRQHHC
ncbi:hypothetical protein D3C86_1609490 [compost metagenome]